jgi:hypothetical protein
MFVKLGDLPCCVNPDKSNFLYGYKQVINNLYLIILIDLIKHEKDNSS